MEAKKLLEDMNFVFPESSKIGEGKFREVFLVDGFVVKTLKPIFRKNYGLFTVNLPTNVYTKYKFGIPDFNEYELEVYKEFIDKVSEGLRDSFYHIYSVLYNEGKSYLIAQVIRDNNGQISQSLKQKGNVPESSFWQRIDQLEDLLIEKDIPLLELNSSNIVARDLGNSVIPVLTDYKRFGSKTYPAQFWLVNRSERAKKIKRRFQILRDKYKE
jgi:hypothetical protein